MKTTPVVGQTLYDLNVGNAARRSPQVLTPVVVASVGRKYFKAGPVGCSEYQLIQFNLEDWSEVSNYSANHNLYQSEQEYADEKEASEICDQLRTLFMRGHNHKNIPMESLRKIKALLP